MELLVVIAVLAILLATIDFGPSQNAKKKAQRINCVSNLHQIGTAFKVWEGDQLVRYPMQISVTNGGTRELAESGIVYVNFQVMSNQLSTPEILVCRADNSRVAATNFSTDFNNGKISYFVGLDAADEYPQRVLSGDDNFEIGGVSVEPGLLRLSTNTPVSWTAARHKHIGNILLADGSVSQTDDKSLVEKLQATGLATNRLAIP